MAARRSSIGMSVDRAPDGHGISPLDARQAALQAIGQALDHLRFGTVVLTVHDARVVQLEVTEKKRFSA